MRGPFWIVVSLLALSACDKPRRRPSDDDSEEPRRASSSASPSSGLAVAGTGPHVEDALLSYSSRTPEVSIRVAFTAAAAVRCMPVDAALLRASKGELVAWLVEAGFDVSVSDKHWTVRGKPKAPLEGCDAKPGSFTLLAGKVTSERPSARLGSANPPDAAELAVVSGVKQLSPSSYELSPATVTFVRERIKSNATMSMRLRPGGARVPELPPDGLAFALGLRGHDTVKALNGKSFAEPQGALDAYEEVMRSAGPFTLVLEREGETITLTYVLR